MDKRLLRTHQTRYRFKLNESSYNLINEALKLADSNYSHIALDKICLDYLSGESEFKLNTNCVGSMRLSIKIYPDQLEVIEQALSTAFEKCKCYEMALTQICESFISSHQANI